MRYRAYSAKTAPDKWPNTCSPRLQRRMEARQSLSPKDAKTAKAHAIEDMVRDLPLAGSEWKQLPDVLAQDEMPEQFLGAEYDDRNGLKVSSGENQIGLLAATDRRLIFIKKPPLLRRKVTEFPYDSIERVEFKKGLFRSQITVFASGREEIFKGFGSEVKEMAEYIEDKID